MTSIEGYIRKTRKITNFAAFKKRVGAKDVTETYKICIKMITHLTINVESYDTITISKIHKLIELLKNINEENKQRQNEIVKHIVENKHILINKLKELKKINPKDNKIELYQKIINQLEEIELSLICEVKNTKETINSNIINKIIFENKNPVYTKYLIERYHYLINYYNKENNDNLFDKVIKEFIKSILKYVEEGDKTYLYYYNDTLEQLMQNKNIEKKFNKEKDLKYIKELFNKNEIKEKKQNRKLLWLNHLYNLIIDSSYKPSIEMLNNLYEIRYYFKPSVLAESNLLTIIKKPEEDNKKTIEDHIITIDSEEVLGRDDALSIKKLNSDLYRLSIHITDPNSYCDINSLIIKEARKRNQTIYLEDQTIHMLPENIIKNLSLDKDKYRYARTYNYEIDKYGELVNFEIKKTIIKATENLTYEEANQIIYTGEGNKETTETIKNLLDLKNIIISNNKDLFNPTSLKPLSETLINFYMVYNGLNIGEYFHKKNLPMIYRAQNIYKNLDGIDLELADRDERIKYTKIIKSIENVNLTAFYSSEYNIHEGMGYIIYTRSSSPLRRYADILANDCEDNFYFKNIESKEAYEYIENLKNEIKYLNSREQEINKYCQKRYKKLD